jgi:hypothetical protein
MQVIFQEVSTLIPSMAIKDSVVCNGNISINHQVLYALIGILIILPLPNVTHYTCIEPLHHKLKCAYPECIAWPQTILLIVKHSPVYAA